MSDPKTVLIVEDEQSISNFISMILTANGFDTIIVRSGEEALRRWRPMTERTAWLRRYPPIRT